MSKKDKELHIRVTARRLLCVALCLVGAVLGLCLLGRGVLGAASGLGLGLLLFLWVRFFMR